MNAKTRTTESLRETLFETLEGVRAGTVEQSTAKTVANLADKIIATARLELDAAVTLSKLDKDGQGIVYGPMMLTRQKAP